MTLAEAFDASALDPGTSVLVEGPSMTGKRALVMSLMARTVDDDRGRVFVTTRTDPSTLRRDFAARDGALAADRFAIVDCVGQGDAESSTDAYVVNSPGDLTGIGIGTTKFMQRFAREASGAWVGLHSLTTMLMYADLRRTFRFLHAMTGRIGHSPFIGVVAVNSETLDERERAIVRQPFDGTVQLRESPDADEISGAVTCEARVRGVPELGPRAWTPL